MEEFLHRPGVEAPPEFGIGFFCRLLHSVYGENVADADGLRRAGFRILPEDQPDFPFWSEGELPSWAKSFLFRDDESSDAVKYLVTFRQFGRLPAPVREGYLGGRLALLPFPGSLVFWGVERARRAYPQLPMALQIPLLANVDRHESPIGIRVPQAGVFHQPNADQPTYTRADGHLRNTYKRTHRWEKILRDQDQVELLGKEASLVNVLFSAIPDDVGLYGKPMARNVQIWTSAPEVLLDGPHASPADIKRAMRTIQAGGVFGYRFLFPAMRVGKHEVYWHRPLVAYRDAAGEVAVLPDAPLGYLTAYRRRQAASGSPHRIMAAHATATGVAGGIGRPGLYPQTSGAAASSQCPQADSCVRPLRGQATAHQLRPPNHGTRPRRRRRKLAGTIARAGVDPYPRDC